jgi:flavin-dependent dehydrogenase
MTPLPTACDVVVLGGGPAGAAAAITLARAGRSVVILEKSQYESTRIGETLPPAARVSLERLGVWDEFLAAGHLPSPAVLSAWGEEDLHESPHLFNAYGHGWHLDRARFDTMLADAASRAGAHLCCGAHIRTCQPLVADRWQFEIACSTRAASGRCDRLQAAWVIDATGRAAVWARQQGARRINHDRLVGLAGWLAGRSAARARGVEDKGVGNDGDPCTLVEACADGWWYSARLPDARVIATYVTDADVLPHRRGAWPAFWKARLQDTTHTRARLYGLDLTSVPRLVAANSSRLDRASGRGWLAVGDAAMAFDPLSAQGLMRALTSGRRAGEDLDRLLAGDATAMDERETRANALFREYARRREFYYGHEQRWPQSIFWRRRHADAPLSTGVTTRTFTQ